LCLCIIISAFNALGQKKPTTTYAQFWDEIQFTAALKGKWAFEFNFGNTWTSKANESSLFYKAFHRHFDYLSIKLAAAIRY
jgi:hypothetical protein